MNHLILFLACLIVGITTLPTIVVKADDKFYSEMERMCGFTRKQAKLWLSIKGKRKSLRDCTEFGQTRQGKERVMRACRFSDERNVDSLLIVKLRSPSNSPAGHDRAVQHCNAIENFDGAIDTMVSECAFPASRAPLHIVFRGSEDAITDCTQAKDIQIIVVKSLRACEWSADTAFWQFAQKGWERFSWELREHCGLDL